MTLTRVPPGAAAVDLAREYAAQSTLTAIPLIYTRTGEPLRPDLALADAGVESGDVLVATTSVHRPSAPATRGAAALAGPIDRRRRPYRRGAAIYPPGPLSQSAQRRDVELSCTIWSGRNRRANNRRV